VLESLNLSIRKTDFSERALKELLSPLTQSKLVEVKCTTRFFYVLKKNVKILTKISILIIEESILNALFALKYLICEPLEKSSFIPFSPKHKRGILYKFEFAFVLRVTHLSAKGYDLPDFYPKDA